MRDLGTKHRAATGGPATDDFRLAQEKTLYISLLEMLGFKLNNPNFSAPDMNSFCHGLIASTGHPAKHKTDSLFVRPLNKLNIVLDPSHQPSFQKLKPLFSRIIQQILIFHEVSDEKLNKLISEFSTQDLLMDRARTNEKYKTKELAEIQEFLKNSTDIGPVILFLTRLIATTIQAEHREISVPVFVTSLVPKIQDALCRGGLTYLFRSLDSIVDDSVPQSTDAPSTEDNQLEREQALYASLIKTLDLELPPHASPNRDSFSAALLQLNPWPKKTAAVTVITRIEKKIDDLIDIFLLQYLNLPYSDYCDFKTHIAFIGGGIQTRNSKSVIRKNEKRLAISRKILAESEQFEPFLLFLTQLIATSIRTENRTIPFDILVNSLLKTIRINFCFGGISDLLKKIDSLVAESISPFTSQLSSPVKAAKTIWECTPEDQWPLLFMDNLTNDPLNPRSKRFKSLIERKNNSTNTIRLVSKDEWGNFPSGTMSTSLMRSVSIKQNGQYQVYGENGVLDEGSVFDENSPDEKINLLGLKEELLTCTDLRDHPTIQDNILTILSQKGAIYDYSCVKEVILNFVNTVMTNGDHTPPFLDAVLELSKYHSYTIDFSIFSQFDQRYYEHALPIILRHTQGKKPEEQEKANIYLAELRKALLYYTKSKKNVWGSSKPTDYVPVSEENEDSFDDFSDPEHKTPVFDYHLQIMTEEALSLLTQGQPGTIYLAKNGAYKTYKSTTIFYTANLFTDAKLVDIDLTSLQTELAQWTGSNDSTLVSRVVAITTKNGHTYFPTDQSGHHGLGEGLQFGNSEIPSVLTHLFFNPAMPYLHELISALSVTIHGKADCRDKNYENENPTPKLLTSKVYTAYSSYPQVAYFVALALRQLAESSRIASAFTKVRYLLTGEMIDKLLPLLVAVALDEENNIAPAPLAVYLGNKIKQGVSLSDILCHLRAEAASPSAASTHYSADLASHVFQKRRAYLSTRVKKGRGGSYEDYKGSQSLTVSGYLHFSTDVLNLIKQMVDIDNENELEKRLRLAEFKGDIPDNFLCPLTLRIMTDPVSHIDEPRFVYDHPFIDLWVKSNLTSPMTRKPLSSNGFRPNTRLFSQIIAFVETEEAKKTSTTSPDSNNPPSTSREKTITDLVATGLFRASGLTYLPGNRGRPDSGSNDPYPDPDLVTTPTGGGGPGNDDQNQQPASVSTSPDDDSTSTDGGAPGEFTGNSRIFTQKRETDKTNPNRKKCTLM